MVPNGVDPLVFHPDDRSTRGGGPSRVLVVSRLMPDKDPLTMADAVVEVQRRGHPVELDGGRQWRTAARDRTADCGRHPCR